MSKISDFMKEHKGAVIFGMVSVLMLIVIVVLVSILFHYVYPTAKDVYDIRNTESFKRMEKYKTGNDTGNETGNETDGNVVNINLTSVGREDNGYYPYVYYDVNEKNQLKYGDHSGINREYLEFPIHIGKNTQLFNGMLINPGFNFNAGDDTNCYSKWCEQDAFNAVYKGNCNKSQVKILCKDKNKGEAIKTGDIVYFESGGKYLKASSDGNRIKWDSDSGESKGNFANSEFYINIY